MLREERPGREMPPAPEPTGEYSKPTRTIAEPIWLEPYPDAWLEYVPDSAPGPEARYDKREAIELAFVIALQHLSARERAAVVLKDVLGYRVAETAELLDASEASINSALPACAREAGRAPRRSGGRPGS